MAGFTLVELLVVIAIVVVLLALMAAGLDRAIYSAELAVCGTRLHAMSNGATTYAMAHNRKYPHRPGVQETPAVLDGDWEPHKLYQKFPDGRIHDERPIIKGFIALESTLDPLCKPVILSEAITEPEDIVFRNSHQWAGFKWFGFEGMQKMGDRLTFTNSTHYPAPRTFRFSLLASDRDFFNTETLVVDSSHPDDESLLVSMSWQSEDVSGGFGLLADTALQATYSGWYGLGSVRRGKSDFNYAHEDGSVNRINGVLDQNDPRMTRVPHYANIAGVPTVGSWPTQYDHLPIE